MFYEQFPSGLCFEHRRRRHSLDSESILRDRQGRSAGEYGGMGGYNGKTNKGGKGIHLNEGGPCWGKMSSLITQDGKTIDYDQSMRAFTVNVSGLAAGSADECFMHAWVNWTECSNCCCGRLMDYGVHYENLSDKDKLGCEGWFTKAADSVGMFFSITFRSSMAGKMQKKCPAAIREKCAPASTTIKSMQASTSRMMLDTTTSGRRGASSSPTVSFSSGYQVANRYVHPHNQYPISSNLGWSGLVTTNSKMPMKKN